MPKKPSTSNEAVQKATGKTWPQWFAILDTAGAKNMDHAAIARWLATKKNVRPWWTQMVTVEYERVRKGRKKHERQDGYEISAGTTLPASMGTLYAGWMNSSKRRRWLREPLTPKKTKQKKTLRYAWKDGTPIDVRFDERPSGKCRVMVTQSKLKSARQAAQMKKYWRSALTRFSKNWM